MASALPNEHLAREILPRDFPGSSKSGNLVRALTALSLTFGMISVLSTLVASYWFVKMRRSFRHDLIMLLIMSDLLKAFWFAVFPIVDFAHGPIESNSAFCQVSGFFLTVGIEASDVAVLLIAIHSVMYIFRPKSGLWPYRKIAYFAWFCFPLIIATLAFINDSGYENVGYYCYLRTEYSWARLFLSWIPRYLICGLILFIYVFVYLYVKRKMDRYGRRSSSTPPPSRRERGDHVGSIPPTPPIAYHGLIPSTPSSRRGSAADAKDRQRSVSSIGTIKLDGPPFRDHGRGTTPNPRVRRPTPTNWSWSGWPNPGTAPITSPEGGLLHEEDPLSPVQEGRVAQPSPALAPSPGLPRPTTADDSIPSGDYPPAFWHQPLHSNGVESRQGDGLNSPNLTIKSRVSRPNIFTVLRGGPRPPDEVQRTDSTPSIHLSPSAIADDSGIARNREKIRRQLRALFVYPLAYMLTWVFPFISHVRGFDDSLSPFDPAWLLVVSIISLCIQGTVDCLMFTCREKPWLHPKIGFWDAVRKRLTRDKNAHVAGRTREEMLVDGRIARARRNQEIVAERMMSRGGLVPHVDSTSPRRRIAREWWDIEVDGGADLCSDSEDGDAESLDARHDGAGHRDSNLDVEARPLSLT